MAPDYHRKLHMYTTSSHNSYRLMDFVQSRKLVVVANPKIIRRSGLPDASTTLIDYQYTVSPGPLFVRLPASYATR